MVPLRLRMNEVVQVEQSRFIVERTILEFWCIPYVSYELTIDSTCKGHKMATAHHDLVVQDFITVR
jgi:hypothetical protein